jgi:hypothetical protein
MIYSSTPQPPESPVMFRRPIVQTVSCSVAFIVVMVSGCASKPDTPRRPILAPQPMVERFQIPLEEGFSLNYQIERQISKVNGTSCFAFITGTLNNRSNNAISKKSVLDVSVFSQGKQLYRDLTYPLTDVSPGTSSAFEMVTSPVHPEGCPPYERISITLRKVGLEK